MCTLRDCELGLCSWVETTRPRMRHPLKAVLSVQLVKTKSHGLWHVPNLARWVIEWYDSHVASKVS